MCPVHLLSDPRQLSYLTLPMPKDILVPASHQNLGREQTRGGFPPADQCISAPTDRVMHCKGGSDLDQCAFPVSSMDDFMGTKAPAKRKGQPHQCEGGGYKRNSRGLKSLVAALKIYRCTRMTMQFHDLLNVFLGLCICILGISRYLGEVNLIFKRVRSGFTGPYLHGVSRADNLQWHLCTGGVDSFLWREPSYYQFYSYILFTE